MEDYERKKASARLLLSRLERLSADSFWAHQASGLRGSLLRCLEQGEGEGAGTDLRRLEALVERGFLILFLAARELRGSTLKTFRR